MGDSSRVSNVMGKRSLIWSYLFRTFKTIDICCFPVVLAPSGGVRTSSLCIFRVCEDKQEAHIFSGLSHVLKQKCTLRLSNCNHACKLSKIPDAVYPVLISFSKIENAIKQRAFCCGLNSIGRPDFFHQRGAECSLCLSQSSVKGLSQQSVIMCYPFFT